MATPTIPGAPPTACPSCGSPLAEDQRYCLECGARPGEPRISNDELVRWTADDAAGYAPGTNGNGNGNGHGPAAPVTAPPAGPRRDWMPLIALGGLATLALVLVVGVLIGKSGNNNSAAPAPQVIRLDGGAPAAAAATTTPSAGTAGATSFTSDWPAGRDGWTIEIGSLTRASTQPAAVATARSAATARGVAAVGALDSDGFPSLPSGQYVLYSGSYDSRAAATRALAAVKTSYPDASVVQVSQTAASGGSASSSTSTTAGSATTPAATPPPANRALQGATGSTYERKAAASPRTQATGGKAPAAQPRKTSGFDDSIG